MSWMLYAAWAQSLVATVGSLYFSEVMRLPPCALCWYQRIFMYPLVLILAVGIGGSDPRVRWYALPLALIGFAVAAYHNLLYYNVIPEGFGTCSLGVSCTVRQVELFGFVGIPQMSLTAFTVILALLLLSFRKGVTRANQPQA